MKQLLKRTVTPAMAAANQANSLKSTGPVTEQQGHLVSRRNARKHWGQAETIRPLLLSLEEESEEFDRVRDALYRALAPRDDFEEIIVGPVARARTTGKRPTDGPSAGITRQRRACRASIRRGPPPQTCARLDRSRPISHLILTNEAGISFDITHFHFWNSRKAGMSMKTRVVKREKPEC